MDINLVDHSIQYITENFDNKNILISAKTLSNKNSTILTAFNNKRKGILEDGILHIKMLRT